MPSPPLTNLIAWWEANVGVTATGGLITGNPVTAWADQSGGGNNLIASTSNATYETNQINGFPALLFSNANLTGAECNLTSAATVFTVFKLSSLAAKSTLFSGSNGSLSTGFNDNGGSGAVVLQTADSAAVALLGKGNAPADLDWHQVNLTYSASVDLTFRLDGSSDGGSGTVVTDISANNTFVGDNQATDSEFFTGYVAEMLVYSAAIGLTAIETVEAYLQAKYFPSPGGGSTRPWFGPDLNAAMRGARG